MGDFRRFKANWFDSSPTEVEAPAAFNPESVSAVLRNTRILHGYRDVQEVAAEIKVRPAYLEAIEDGRFHDLPAVVYAQGFVAAYARFLMLDPEDMVARFKAEASGGVTPLPPVAAPVMRASIAANGKGETHAPNMQIFIAAAVLLGLAYGGWQLAGNNEARRDALAVPPLPQSMAAVAAAPKLPELPAAETAAPAPKPEARLSLIASADSWVQIYAEDGTRVVSLLLKANESYLIPPLGKLKLVTDTPQNMNLEANGRRFDLPSDPDGRAEIWIDSSLLLSAPSR